MDTETIPPMTTTDPALQPLCDAIVGCCDTESGPYILSAPRFVDGVLYASDGRLAVRVEGDGSPFRPRSAVGRFPNSIGDVFTDSIVDPDWKSPTVPYVPCSNCNDVPASKCTDCDGSGVDECPRCGHEEDCSACGGKGEFGGCDKCFGRSFIVNEVDIAAKLWRKVHAFTKCGELQVSASKKHRDRIVFRVVDGTGNKIVDGVVMGTEVARV